MVIKNNLCPAFMGTLLWISGCTTPQSPSHTPKTTEWKKLTCGLFLSPDGELGFATDAEIANIPKSKLAPERCANVFITHIGTEGKISLASVIDTLTFEALGSGFYKDKSTIYNHYEICEGGYLNIFAKDTADFRVLGPDYVGYKSEIYHYSNGVTDADPKTFKTSHETGAYAKDKYGFFANGERISAEELIKDAGPEMLERLKEL